MTLDHSERVALVTGASRGIGAGLARRFAEVGLRVVVCSRTPPVLPDGERVLSRTLDVRDPQAMESLVGTAESRFGAIDLWVNNAGVLDPIAPVREIPVEAFREHLDINLTGVLIGSQCYVRHLRRRGRGGVLINLSSGAATKAYAGWGAYCAAKAGVDLLSRVIAEEEAAQGLRVHAVAPGIVDTDMQAMIRSARPEDFPSQPRFLDYKRNDAFNSAGYVADRILALAFDPDQRPQAVSIRLEDEDRSQRG